MVFINPVTDITVIAVAYSAFARVMQQRLNPPEKMKAHQQVMRKKQEQMRKLVDAKDKKSQRELENLQQEMMSLTMESFRSMGPYLAVVMPLALVIFWFLNATYGGILIEMPFPFPWGSLGEGGFFSVTFFLTETTNWLGWYALVSLIFMLLLNLALRGLKMISGEPAKGAGA